MCRVLGTGGRSHRRPADRLHSRAKAGLVPVLMRYMRGKGPKSSRGVELLRRAPLRDPIFLIADVKALAADCTREKPWDSYHRQFILEQFRGRCVKLSQHMYGCRVV